MTDKYVRQYLTLPDGTVQEIRLKVLNEDPALPLKDAPPIRDAIPASTTTLDESDDE